MSKHALTLVAAALLLGAAPAQADYDPLGSGTTKLTLDKAFLALAKDNGVKLSATAPAKLAGNVLSFPVSGGKFDPTTATGTVEHEGALLFRVGSRSIPVKALQLKTTQRHSPFSAKVGGSQLKLAAAQSMKVTRAGFADKVKVTKLSLAAKLAGRLNKKLRLVDAFAAGQPLGSTQTRANPVTVAIAGGQLAFVPDPGFAAKLNGLFVALNPIFPAEHPGAFTLPIAGGALAPNGSQGRLETLGSLEFLQLGGGQVFWADPLLDFAAATFSPELNIQPSPPYAGKVGAVAVAGLAGAAFASDPKARTIALQGAALTLSAVSAQAFNEAFAERKEVFRPGEALGSLSFTAQGQ
jgi:hypothetical protein